jgi:hypothetical protein
MNKEAIVGWGLGSLAVAVGYVQWGWPGVVLATTLVVFWLLLQFSRALRAMRGAAGAPVGSVPSAVMLHAQLSRGLKLAQLMRLAGSLGRPVGDDPEAYEWTDASGACLHAELERGRLVRWELRRMPAAPMVDERPHAAE